MMSQKRKQVGSLAQIQEIGIVGEPFNYRLGIKEKKTLAFSWHIVYNNTEITFNMVSD